MKTYLRLGSQRVLSKLILIRRVMQYQRDEFYPRVRILLSPLELRILLGKVFWYSSSVLQCGMCGDQFGSNAITACRTLLEHAEGTQIAIPVPRFLMDLQRNRGNITYMPWYIFCNMAAIRKFSWFGRNFSLGTLYRSVAEPRASALLYVIGLAGPDEVDWLRQSIDKILKRKHEPFPSFKIGPSLQHIRRDQGEEWG